MIFVKLQFYKLIYQYNEDDFLYFNNSTAKYYIALLNSGEFLQDLILIDNNAHTLKL